MSSPERPPSPLPAFLAYLFLIFLAATLLSPAIHAVLSPTYPAPPGRYFRRVLEGSALLLLLLFRNKMGLHSWRDVGLRAPVLRPFLWGCLLGLVSGLICLLPLLLPILSDRPAGVRWDLSSFAAWLGRGLLIALAEELLFRGIFFTVLMRGLGPLRGLLASSFLFGLAHYLRSVAPVPEASSGIFSGWGLLHAHLAPILSLSWLEPQGLLLFSVGAALAAAYRATSSLWMPVGIHAFWVALLYGTTGKPAAPSSSLWSAFVIAVFGVLLWTGFGPRRLGRPA